MAVNQITAVLNKPIWFSDYDSAKALELLSNYSETVPKIRDHPDEFEWSMENAQAFITSVQTTTGTSQYPFKPIILRHLSNRLRRHRAQDHGGQALHHLLCDHQHSHIHVVHLQAGRRLPPRLHESHLHPSLMRLVKPNK